MTFTEAAVEVLRREGKPLHFKKIAEVAIRENLLDHVGKIPEEVMGGQLATHCRLPRSERSIIAVQPGTFALAEWGLEEDPNGLEGIAEVPPEEAVAYRPKERHPVPLRDLGRGAGREAGRGRRREEGEERRGRRFPPPAEVAYEILAGADRALPLTEVAALGAERFLMPDAFVRDAGSLGAALREDNRRRESAGRQPLFVIEGETVSLAARPEAGERAPVAAAAARTSPGAAEMRRSALSALRRRIRECDPATVEHLAARLLGLLGLREAKVAKRGREQVVFTGRKRMGLVDVRHCARVVRTSADVGRREVSEVRRDLGHFGAQIGLLITAGDAGRDARAEAAAAGQLPVVLLCGEALAEAFAELSLGCRPVIVPEVDEAFFKAAAEASEREEAARIARREERERRERAAGEPAAASPVREISITSEGAPPAGEAAPSSPEPVEPEGDEDAEGEEEEGQAPPGAGGLPREGGEGRRRRRRRRRRGGRGRGERRPGAPGEPGAGPTVEASGGEAGAGAPSAPPPAPPAEPPPAPSEPSGGEPAS